MVRQCRPYKHCVLISITHSYCLGRIKECQIGSGSFDSWSWNSSNFYHEDVMDLTYTDPSYLPVYSLDGIPKSLLEVRAFFNAVKHDGENHSVRSLATLLCLCLGLHNQLRFCPNFASGYINRKWAKKIQ